MAMIAIANQKGGCGKSTTAVHLLHWLTHQRGDRAVLVDADRQQSSRLWLADLDPPPPCVAITEPETLIRALPQLARRYRHVVVDCPPDLGRTTQGVLLRVDGVLVPVQPAGVDLRSAAATLRLVAKVRERRAGLPRVAVFLNRAVRRTRLKHEALETLARVPSVMLLDTVLHQRQAIADTSGQAATVWDLQGPAAAASAAEFAALFQELTPWLAPPPHAAPCQPIIPARI